MEPQPNLMIEIAGWVPAIVFPTATALQLAKIIKEKDAKSISKATWFLFGLANIGLYFYAEKYVAVQSIVGFLGTAILDFIIVGLAFSRNR